MTHWISLEAEIAHPQLCSVIDLTHRVQDGPARRPGAHDRLVHDRRQIRTLLERLIENGERDHQFRRFNSTRWPDVPGESDAVTVLILLDELFVGGHLPGWSERN